MNPDCFYCGLKDGANTVHVCDPEKMKDTMENMSIKMADNDKLLANLKELFEELIEPFSEGGDIDSFELYEKAEKLGLIKRIVAPKDDEFDYYIFPIWATEREIKNTMGGEV